MAGDLVVFDEHAVFVLHPDAITQLAGMRSGVGVNVNCPHLPDSACVEPNVVCYGDMSNSVCASPNAVCDYESQQNATCVAPNVMCNV